MKFEARIGTSRIECDVNLDAWPRVQSEIDGKALEVHLSEVDRGGYWLSLEGRSVEASVVVSAGIYHVRIGNETYRVELVERRQGRSGRTRSGPSERSREIRAPMPGRVIEVFVSEGDTVEPNQGLFVLEAMKMQNELKAPCQGTVRSVRASAGMSVNAGELLAIVE